MGCVVYHNKHVKLDHGEHAQFNNVHIYIEANRFSEAVTDIVIFGSSFWTSESREAFQKNIFTKVTLY